MNNYALANLFGSVTNHGHCHCHSIMNYGNNFGSFPPSLFTQSLFAQNYFMPQLTMPNNNIFMNYSMPSFDMPSFAMPSFAMPSFSRFNLDLTRKTKKSTWNLNTKSSLPQLADINYDGEKGKILVEEALSRASSSSKHVCAAYVKNAIIRSGLGKFESGHAYQCANILAKNNNFKEVNVSGNDLKKLPAGCIIVYNKGAAGYSSEYGHVEITTGTGIGVSDFVNKNIRSSDNVRVFAPVKLQA